MNKTDKTMRGEFISYLISLIVFCLSVIFILGLFIKLDPEYMRIYGTRHATFVIPFAGNVWRMLHRCLSSWVFILLPIMWVFATYLIQSGLKKDMARKFNIIHTIFIIVIFVILIFLVISLTMRPLIQWG